MALRESREFLGKMVNSISDPIYVVDRQHRYVLVNDALCALTGRKRDDILGGTDYDFFAKEQVNVLWERDEQVFATGEENEYEEDVTDSNGTTRTVVTKRTLYTDKAENKFIVGIIRDITHRKEAELALQAAHQQLQDIIEFLPDATFVIDREKKVICWSRAMEELSGLKKQDILGQTDYAYAIPFYGERRPLLIDLVMVENPEIETRYDYFQRKGTTLYGEGYFAGAYQGKGAYFWSTATLLFGRDGSVTGSIQSIRDISEHKRAEEAIRKSEERYRQLFETVSDAILVFDGETGKFIDLNESALRLYGYPYDEFLELKYTDIAAGPDLSDETINETLAGIRSTVPLCYHRRKDETLFPVEISSSSFDLYGRTVLCGVIRDITERIQAEEQLKAYRDHLEELVKERTAELARANERLTLEIEERNRAEESLKLFAYSVAHDLKSPAIGIHGLTGRLQKHCKDLLDEKGKNYCDQVLKASVHIAALVEQINVYIRTKEVPPLIEKTGIKEIMTILRAEFSEQLRTRRIDWFEPQSEVEIMADRLSILRVFRNFVDNALKYGGERLSKIWIGHEETADFHIFSVIDNGKGLKGADPEKIFGLFQRHETSRGVEGAGLGMTIVKEIAQKHGGQAWLEQRGKRGTTFCISISKNL